MALKFLQLKSKGLLYLTLLILIFTQKINCQGMMGAGLPKKCKQTLVESYNLSSYVDPRGLNMWLCPSIESSCCSIYEQFTMFQLWNKEVKKRMVEHFEGIREKVDKVGKMTKVVMKQDLKAMIKKLKMKMMAKRRAIMLLGFVKRKNPIRYLTLAHRIQPSNAHYMQKVRSAFYCVICDFKNHHFFKLEQKKFIMNKGSCAAIAENTINFTYLLHVKIAPQLLRLAKILALFDPNPGAPLKINHFRKVMKATRMCAISFVSAKGGNNGSACKQYCSYFNINNTSAVQEGYEVFFNDMMNIYEKFFRHMDIDWKKADDSRILSTEYQNNKRILQAKGGDVLTQDDFLKIKDPYKEGVVHPEFNDHTISTMFNFQQGYDVDRHAGYRNFAKNKMFYFDAGVNYSEAMPKELFRTSPSNVVKLDEFSTEVRNMGATVSKHAETTNIDGPMKDLILHLKLKTRFKIFYEKLDPTMLNEVNGIVNTDVIHFHRDFFIKFDDFSVELKRQEAVMLDDQKKNNTPLVKAPAPEPQQTEKKKEEQPQQAPAQQTQGGVTVSVPANEAPKPDGQPTQPTEPNPTGIDAPKQDAAAQPTDKAVEQSKPEEPKQETQQETQQPKN